MSTLVSDAAAKTVTDSGVENISLQISSKRHAFSCNELSSQGMLDSLSSSVENSLSNNEPDTPSTVVSATFNEESFNDISLPGTGKEVVDGQPAKAVTGEQGSPESQMETIARELKEKNEDNGDSDNVEGNSGDEMCADKDDNTETPKSSEASSPYGLLDANLTANGACTALYVDISHNLIIFDWDDTLSPSSWIASLGMHPDSCVVTGTVKDQLEVIGGSIRRLLDHASKFGTVAIVTNAETGWIEMCCKKFFPSLLEHVVTNFEILSARTTYEGRGFRSPFEWKVQAFSDLVQRHYQGIACKAANKIDTQSLKRHVVSFGDSHHEREALLFIKKQMTEAGCSKSLTKSLKFVERPDIDHLLKEHELIFNCFQQVMSHPLHLDLCIVSD